MRIICSFLFLLISGGYGFGQQSVIMHSPDKKIEVTYLPNKLSYKVKYEGRPLLGLSKLGVTRADDDFSTHPELVKVRPAIALSDHYDLLGAKRRHATYKAIKTVIETKNEHGKRMNIVFQLSNDGVAFRYVFPDKSDQQFQITREATSFHFYPKTRGWLQPKATAQTGFEHTNPSYEAHYMMDKQLDALPFNQNGWVYPALFEYNGTWMLITEAGLGRTYCGTSLQQGASKYEYKINFPQPAEKIPGKELLPASNLPWKTPWRIIALGSLKTIMESTLGTDLAQPAKIKDTKFIRPGKASWSWILKKDAGTVFKVQKAYIDFAAEMNWEYCLIDAGWDQSIGYDSVKILADYAKKKHVGILLWYNSAGNWNTVKFTPRDRLLSHQSRVEEFSRLEKMGIKGIKVDFFGGDGKSMINYYEDILQDAAKYHLLVNFHGATLPRGLQRTYPNYMTAEAVLGYEMITFSQQNAAAAPAHMVMCAFARNVFDPMDFTPMNLYKIPNIKRVTTAGFELATAVVFISGIQHYASSPEGMSHVGEDVKSFLRHLPAKWDDMRFLAGKPGKAYVVARKAGDTWYIAGINGEDKVKRLNLDLSFLKAKRGRLYYCPTGQGSNTILTKDMQLSGKKKVSLKVHGNDGFVAVFKD